MLLLTFFLRFFFFCDLDWLDWLGDSLFGDETELEEVSGRLLLERSTR